MNYFLRKISYNIILILFLITNEFDVFNNDLTTCNLNQDGLFAARITDSIKSPVKYINSSFENASPVYWEYNPDGSVQITCLYDHERESPNRASNHWHFQVQASKGANLVLYLNFFDQVWNGKASANFSRIKNFYISIDGKHWSLLPVEAVDNNILKLSILMPADRVFLTQVEPYRISDLENLKREIKNNPLTEIITIGKTVEGRELEIIRVGYPEAPYRVFIRARSHPWEAGGNWVVQGLIRSLLEKTEEINSYLKKYCLYVLPMANKDGVYRGLTRFNSMGCDLNRNLDLPADPILAPENYAMELWLKTMIDQGKKPHIAIDLHNDMGGKLLVSYPNVNLDTYLTNMRRFEDLLYKHTWFREGSSGRNSRIPGSFGESMIERFGIDGCVLELNRLWIEGLKKEPFGKDWELFGRQLRDVFFEYFEK